jgi:hypothetical protein
VEPESSCGEGVARQSILPAKLADLTEAMAAVLEVHQRALDLTDPSSQAELEAYQKVVHALRVSATQLKATAFQMAASRQVPMGRHDDEAMSSPEALQVFTDYVTAEQELLTLLQDAVEQDQRMLTEMRG